MRSGENVRLFCSWKDLYRSPFSLFPFPHYFDYFHQDHHHPWIAPFSSRNPQSCAVQPMMELKQAHHVRAASELRRWKMGGGLVSGTKHGGTCAAWCIIPV